MSTPTNDQFAAIAAQVTHRSPSVDHVAIVGGELYVLADLLEHLDAEALRVVGARLMAMAVEFDGVEVDAIVDDSSAAVAFDAIQASRASRTNRG